MTDRMKRLFRIPIYCSIAAVAVVTVISAYGGMVNPDVTPIPAILAMTFPLWMILSFVMLVILLLFRPLRRLAWLPAIALIASWSPFTDFAPLHLKSDTVAGAGEGFTVMSFNTYALLDLTSAKPSDDPKQWKREVEAGMINPTVDYILGMKPDILLLQETPRLVSYDKTHFTKAQAKEMVTLYQGREDVEGEMVLTRRKLTPVKLRQPDSPYARFAAALADIDGHETLLVSVHLQSIGLNDDDKELYRDLTEGNGGKRIREVRHQLLGKLAYAFRERASQARLLREQIDSIGVENVIVAGDFNDIPSCYALRVLCGDDFRNAFSDAGRGPIITYHANRFYFHIDHIVYRGKMKVVEFARGKCPYSDHYPVIARFVWEAED